MVPRDEHIDLSLRGRHLRMSWAKFLLLIGLGIIGFLILETLLIAVIAPSLVYPILRGVAGELLTGREAGIPVFLEGGVPPLLAMQYSAMQDLAVSFIVYPIFIFLLKRYYDRNNFVMRWVKRTQDAAERRERMIQRHGPVFLFFFMLIPFMVNGPLVGLLIGRLVRIRMHVLVAVVVAATLVPAVAWTLFYNTLFNWIDNVVPGGPTYITVGVVSFVLLLIIGGSIYDKIKDHKENGAESQEG